VKLRSGLCTKGVSVESSIVRNLNLLCSLCSYIEVVFGRWSLIKGFTLIKTHGSESWGQERVKRSPKTKRATNYCVSFTWANVFVIWRHNHSQYHLEPRQLLNPHCRHKTFLPTLTNTQFVLYHWPVCLPQHIPTPPTQHMHPHNTCTTTGCATTVCWLLIMTTVGKTHAVKQGRIRDFTRGGAQTCHGSWGCIDDHFLIVPCCYNFYHLYIFEVFNIGRKPSSDYTVIIFRGAWYNKRAGWSAIGKVHQRSNPD